MSKGGSGNLTGEQGRWDNLTGEQGRSGSLTGEQGWSGNLTGEQAKGSRVILKIVFRPGDKAWTGVEESSFSPTNFDPCSMQNKAWCIIMCDIIRV